MTTSHIKLTTAATGGGHLEVDGHDVSDAVRGLTIDVNGGDLSNVTLRLVMGGSEIDGIARLWLPWATVGLLARFGWQAPEGSVSNADGSVLLERLTDPKDPRGEKP